MSIVGNVFKKTDFRICGYPILSAKPTKPRHSTFRGPPFVSFVNLRGTSRQFLPPLPLTSPTCTVICRKGPRSLCVACALSRVSVPHQAQAFVVVSCVIPNASLHTNQLKPQSGSKLYRCPDYTPTCFKLLTALILAPFPPIYNISTAHRQVQPTRRRRDIQHPPWLPLHL